MANIEHYHQYVQEIIKHHTQIPPSYGDVDLKMLFDKEHDHDQLVHAGRHGNRRKYGCLIHIDIKDDKIWIQYDGTEVSVVDELVTLGIPKKI